MATVDTQLSDLTSLTDLIDSDWFLVRRGGIDYRATGQQVRKLGWKYGEYSDDIDTISENSVYVVRASDLGDNASKLPSSDSYYVIETEVAGNASAATEDPATWRVQKAFAYSSSRIYTRLYTNSQWYPWLAYADKPSVDYYGTLMSYDSPSDRGLTLSVRRRGYLCDAYLRGTLTQDIATGNGYVTIASFDIEDENGFCCPSMPTIRYMLINRRTTAQLQMASPTSTTDRYLLDIQGILLQIRQRT